MSNTKDKQATLVKPDGERITKEPETVNPVAPTVAENEIDNICKSLLLTANFAGDRPTGAMGETMSCFTYAIIARLCAPIEDHAVLLELLKKRRKAILEYAQSLAGEVEREWIEEVGNLGRVFNADGTPIWIEGAGEGWKFEVTVDEAVKQSASKLLYEFCKASFYSLNGAPAKKNASGKTTPPKKAFEENPDKRGVTKDGFGFSPKGEDGDCDWGVEAALQVMAKTGKAGTKFVKAVHLLVDLVYCINSSDKIGAQKCYNALLGLDDTGRFHFPKSVVKQLIRVRFLGTLVSDLQTEIGQLKALPADPDKLREWKKSRSEDVKQYLTYIDQALLPAETATA